MQREETEKTVRRQAVRKLTHLELEQVVGGMGSKGCSTCGAADLDDGGG